MRDEPVWEAMRREMAVAAKWAYFDHASVAPLCGPARRKMAAWLENLSTSGSADWSRWRAEIEQVRHTAAAFTGAQADEIALVQNTTDGLSIIAEALPWQTGDNVVVPASDFPSNRFPFLNLATRAVEVRQVPAVDERLDLDQLADACDERTRLVSVSWVGYATGWRNDLAAVCDVAHRHGALVMVDAIQGIGVMPLDVRQVPIDFFAADGHKWMLGPEGAGLLFIRREHLDQLRPLGVGWNSVQRTGEFPAEEFDLLDSAARYEGGSYNMVGLLGLGAALAWLSEIGIERIFRRVVDWTTLACESLEAAGAKVASCRDEGRQSGIVALEVPGTRPRRMRAKCRSAGIVLSARGGRVRISAHAYNNMADLERLCDVIRSERR